MSRKETMLILMGGVVIGAAYALFQAAPSSASNHHDASRLMYPALRPVGHTASSNLDSAMSVSAEDGTTMTDATVIAGAIGVQ